MSAKSTSKTDRDTLRTEYRHEDSGAGVRGKYFKRFQAGSNLVLLAPDVAEVFTTPQAVNDALRTLIGVAQRSTRTPAHASRTRKVGKSAHKSP